jgi:hypothetical protein
VFYDDIKKNNSENWNWKVSVIEYQLTLDHLKSLMQIFMTKEGEILPNSK